MNNLLIFFALPVATVILAIVLQKVLRNPLLVAATFFAIYLIVTFAAFDATFLVYAILYTILAFVTAVLVKYICKLIEILRNCLCHNERSNNCNNNNLVNETASLVTVNNTCPGTTLNLSSDTALITNNRPIIRRNGNNNACNCYNCCRKM